MILKRNFRRKRVFPVLTNNNNLNNTNVTSIPIVNPRRNNANRRLKYSMSTKMQSLGISGIKTNVTMQVTSIISDITTLKLRDLLASSSEYQTNRNNYELFKITKIAISVFPILNINNNNNPINANNPLYLNLKYADTSSVTADTIIADENTKVIPSNLNRVRTFVFKVPHFQAGDDFDYKAFHDTDNFNYQTFIYMYSTSNVQAWTIRIDFEVLFKQPKIDVPQRHILVLDEGIFLVNQYELKEIKKYYLIKKELKEKEDREKIINELNNKDIQQIFSNKLLKENELVKKLVENDVFKNNNNMLSNKIKLLLAEKENIVTTNNNRDSEKVKDSESVYQQENEKINNDKESKENNNNNNKISNDEN